MKKFSLLLLMMTLVGLAYAAPVIKNPSFETDKYLDATHPWPGYGPIADWTGGNGINDATGPFFDGLAPDGVNVAQIQHAGKITQTVDGFESGKTYILTYFENARSGNKPHGKVSLGDTVLVDDHEVTSVGTGKNFYFKSVTFNSPGAGAWDLILENSFVDEAPADNTLLYDMANIVEVGSAANILMNLTNLDFGVSTLNVTKDATITIFNNGGSKLTISSISLTGTNKDQFSLDSTSGSIDAGKSLDVTIHFKPTSKDTKTATLEINSNDGDMPKLSVNLTGKGAAGVEVANGSFEADNNPASPGYSSTCTGWTLNGAGCGFMTADAYLPNLTFFDNGLCPDGAKVAFIQGNGNFKQTIPGFTKDQKYTVRIYVNQRTGCPNPAQFQCKLGTLTLFGSATPLAVASVVAQNDFTAPFIYYREVITAPVTGNMDLVIANVNPQGDNTLLFDNVQVLPGDVPDPVPTPTPTPTAQQWNPYTASKSAVSPVIDGVIGPTEYWTSMIDMTLANMKALGGSSTGNFNNISSDSQMSAQYWVTWDDTWLYIAGRFKDSEVVYLADQGTKLNGTDGLQFCLDYNNTGADMNADDSVTIHDVAPGQASNHNQAAYWQHWSKTYGDECGYPKTFAHSQWAGRTVAGGYECELALKWSDMTGFSGPAVGKEMGYLALDINYSSTALVELWLNAGNGDTTAAAIGHASQWNKMKLGDVLPAPVNATREGWSLYE